MVLANIGEALISFDKHVTSMFTSGSMITVVAQLLNHPARISRVLKEAPNGSNPSSGRRTSSTSNSDSEQDMITEMWYESRAAAMSRQGQG